MFLNVVCGRLAERPIRSGQLQHSPALCRPGGLTAIRSLTKVREMDETRIPQVRSFNRVVAERFGTLHDRFLGRARPMGESRLLWEIGPSGADVRSLRGRLGLDSGYLSRVLRSLENQGLIEVSASTADGRLRRVCLTSAGRKERAELDRRSDALVLDVLEALTEQQRSRLAAAMADVERLLQASMVTYEVEDPAGADAKWCFEQYFTELNRRFDTGFEPARSISAEPDELTPPAGLLVVARLRCRVIGCGALKFHPKKQADLKRMWVAPDVRGLGVGRRMLFELERHARASGVAVVRLETNQTLTEAISLYRRSGYVEVGAFSDEPYAHHWFEKRLTPKRRSRSG